MSVEKSIAIIAVCAVCTFAERLLPFVLFAGRSVPKTVKYLGEILPTAVIATLVVYCLRSTDITSASSVVPAVAGVAVTAILHWIKGNTLLSVTCGTACYMILVQAVFH